MTASRLEYQDRLTPDQRTKVDNYVDVLTGGITKDYKHIDSNLETLHEIQRLTRFGTNIISIT